MTDFKGRPGAIDDPGMKGGLDPEERTLPPGNTADDTGDTGPADEPATAELTLPGPHDPVAWTYVEPGTTVIGREGVSIGTIKAMLGTEAEGIFHGIALDPAEGGAMRVIPADAVTSLTPSQVRVQVATDEVERLEEHRTVA